MFLPSAFPYFCVSFFTDNNFMRPVKHQICSWLINLLILRRYFLKNIASDFLFKILSAFYGNFQFFHIFLYRRSRFFPVFIYHIHHDASCGNSISHFFHLLKFFRMMTIKSHHDGRICRFPNNGDDICQISFYICFPICRFNRRYDVHKSGRIFHILADTFFRCRSDNLYDIYSICIGKRTYFHLFFIGQVGNGYAIQSDVLCFFKEFFLLHS